MIMSTSHAEVLVDFKTAKLILRVSEAWLRKQLAAKMIPHYKIGRCIKFRVSELEEYIRSRKIA
jgi:excisionase family DNA binding protein